MSLNPLETMDLPCKLDVCDGSGWSGSYDPQEEDTMCPCNSAHPDNRGDDRSEA